MQQNTTGLFPAPFVIDQVQPARQQHVRGTDEGVSFVPFDQGYLVQRRCLVRCIVEKDPRPRPALYPKIAKTPVPGNRVVSAVKPGRDL